MNTREQHDALNTLASVALNDYDELRYDLIPAFEAITGRSLVDDPRMDDAIDSFVRETDLLRRLVEGSVVPFDIDERLGNNDADYLGAVEIQQRRVDDERFTVLHGRVVACRDCQRTTSNYHPAIPGTPWCGEHGDAYDRAQNLPIHLVSVSERAGQWSDPVSVFMGMKAGS